MQEEKHHSALRGCCSSLSFPAVGTCSVWGEWRLWQLHTPAVAASSLVAPHPPALNLRALREPCSVSVGGVKHEIPPPQNLQSTEWQPQFLD